MIFFFRYPPGTPSEFLREVLWSFSDHSLKFSSAIHLVFFQKNPSVFLQEHLWSSSRNSSEVPQDFFLKEFLQSVTGKYFIAPPDNLPPPGVLSEFLFTFLWSSFSSFPEIPLEHRREFLNCSSGKVPGAPPRISLKLRCKYLRSFSWIFFGIHPGTSEFLREFPKI